MHIHLLCCLLAASPGDDEPDLLRRAADVQSAAVAVLTAEAGLQDWKLAQLRRLLQQGHASWREVAEQEVVCAAWHAHREAAVAFAGFVQQMAGDGRLCELARRESEDPRNHRVWCYLPGSVRLAGSLPARTDSTALFEVSLESPQDAQDELDQREKALAEADRRWTRLRRSADVRKVEDELQRAAWERQLAQAQWERARADQLWRAAGIETFPGPEPAEGLDFPGDAPVPLRTLAPLPQVDQLTLALAAAEAGATGPKQLAEAVLHRQQQRYQALQQLVAGGNAAERELEQARAALRAAEQEVAQEREHREELLRVLHSLQSEQAGGNDGWELDESALPGAYDEALIERLANAKVSAASIWHLVALRRAQLESTAQRQTLLAELAMKEALRERLAKVKVAPAVLDRECEVALARVQECQARLQTAEERCAILRLEERRFCLLSPFLDRGPGPWLRPGGGFLELPSLRESDRLRYVTPGEERLSVCRDWGPAGLGPTWYERRRWRYVPRDPFDDSWLRLTLPRSASPCDYASYRGACGAGPGRGCFSFPVYEDYYSFGIRQLDRPAPDGTAHSLGLPPWYLPGSPTNFR